MKEKTCIRCKETKPVQSYYANWSTRDGFFPWCVECHKRMTRARAERVKLERLQTVSESEIRRGLV